jgi:hypothetical protein
VIFASPKKNKLITLAIKWIHNARVAMGSILLMMSQEEIQSAPIVVLFCQIASCLLTQGALFVLLAKSGYKLIPNLKTAQGW